MLYSVIINIGVKVITYKIYYIDTIYFLNKEKGEIDNLNIYLRLAKLSIYNDMLNEEFEIFLKKCQIKVREKQNKLNEEYGISRFNKYQFSQKDKTIKLMKETGEFISFKAVCIGSWGYEDESWVWAWHNNNLSDEIRTEAEELKKLKDKTGFAVFEEGSFKCEEIVGKDLAFVSVQELKADGIYRIQADESYLYLALFVEEN